MKPTKGAEPIFIFWFLYLASIPRPKCSSKVSKVKISYSLKILYNDLLNGWLEPLKVLFNKASSVSESSKPS